MPEASRGVRRVEQIMGMPIIVDLQDTDVDISVIEKVFDWLRFVDTTFSTYRSDSDISRLNRGELTLEAVHPDVREVLARCDQLKDETNGYFDIRAPFKGPDAEHALADSISAPVDPSGLVKGWSVDRAAQILDAAGAHNYYINAGGDVILRGRPSDGPLWRIGIQHPFVRDRVAVVVSANDLAIATSGAYERGEHIVDPHTGFPPTGILSVTIVGP
ncbi:MAG: thiamine biosynthesis protein, partial [Chloroflexi bacterium]|nr:thiamine biosynthesis protein [Chloroflexota bacterium]